MKSSTVLARYIKLQKAYQVACFAYHKGAASFDDMDLAADKAYKQFGKVMDLLNAGELQKEDVTKLEDENGILEDNPFSDKMAGWKAFN